ncbi:MAG: hypothetical protein LBH98_09645 [Chitinispirillales bacterium]|nr:hypothetical protein [Chitinispirillales bacterium]
MNKTAAAKNIFSLLFRTMRIGYALISAKFNYALSFVPPPPYQIPCHTV